MHIGSQLDADGKSVIKNSSYTYTCRRRESSFPNRSNGEWYFENKF